MKITKIIAAFMVAGLIGAIGCGAEEEVGTAPTDEGTNVMDMGENEAMGDDPGAPDDAAPADAAPAADAAPKSDE